MATVTLGVTTASTSNASSYASGSFTPAAGDLLVALVTASGTVATTTGGGTMTDSQSLGWTRIAATGYNTAADTVAAFVANKTAANSAMTVTWDCTGDSATGATVTVYRIAGAEGTYVRQAAAASGAAAATPTVSLSVAALTGNPLVAACGNGANPAALSPRSSPVWTESSDTGYGTPPSGHQCMFINSGETASSIAWGGTSGTAWGAVVVELYNSGTGARPEDSVSGYYGAISAA